jgi:hypothetical protein
MSSRIVMSTIAAIGCAAALHAQAPTSQESNRAVPGEVTITGCVERADQMAANTTAAAAVDSLTFMLIHAEAGSADETRPTGTSGTTTVARGNSYKLEGDVSTLNPHVGHKVEITGTIAAPTAPTSDTVEPASPAAASRLKVDHIKMVSETCAR